MKKLSVFYTLLFVIIITAACSKENDQLSVSSSQQSSVAKGHFIGENFGGGIIFYLDNTKTHGIIAAPNDFEEPSFWSAKDTLNGALASKLGAGKSNSNRIYKAQGNPQNEADDYAAIECIGLIQNGYNDWYLPSKDELNEMFLHKDIIGGFTPFSYWSSTEQNKSQAWFQNFTSGGQVLELKTSQYALRPVRYF